MLDYVRQEHPHIRGNGFETPPLLLHAADGEKILYQMVQAIGMPSHHGDGLSHHLTTHPSLLKRLQVAVNDR
jgi:hypothetical protein